MHSVHAEQAETQHTTLSTQAPLVRTTRIVCMQQMHLWGESGIDCQSLVLHVRALLRMLSTGVGWYAAGQQVQAHLGAPGPALLMLCETCSHIPIPIRSSQRSWVCPIFLWPTFFVMCHEMAYASMISAFTSAKRRTGQL